MRTYSRNSGAIWLSTARTFSSYAPTIHGTGARAEPGSTRRTRRCKRRRRARPLVRSSNNGLSAVFDQYGRMRPSFVLRDSGGKVWDASTPSPAPAMDVSDESGRPVDGRTLRPKRPFANARRLGLHILPRRGVFGRGILQKFRRQADAVRGIRRLVCRRVRGGFLPVMRAGARGSFPEHSKKSLKSAGKLKYSPPQ